MTGPSEFRKVLAFDDTPPAVPTDSRDTFRVSAETFVFPAHLARISQREFEALAADLVRKAFPATSVHAMAERAERETGIASSDTFERILTRKTKRIDARLIFVVLAIYHGRTGRGSDFIRLFKVKGAR